MLRQIFFGDLRGNSLIRSGIFMALAAWQAIAGIVFGMSPSEEISLFEGEVFLFSTDEEHVPVLIGENDFAGARFQAQMPTNRIRVSCPSYSNGIGSLTLSLYQWRGSVEASREEKPIARKRYVDFSDNEALALSFEPLPAGEYYWELSEAEEKVGVWKRPQTVDGVRSFFNSQEVNGAYEMRVQYVELPFPFSGTEELFSYLIQPTLAPNETQRVSDENGDLLAREFEERDLMADTWDAMDGLGRRLGDSEKYGLPRNKQVGIFYWTWHENFVTRNSPQNNAQLLRENPGLDERPDDPAWGKQRERHHWDEPLFGYYQTIDSWVLRRHAQLLSAAGVDTVVFDATNGTFTWMDSTWTLLKTWSAMRRDGIRTPKFVFMLPFGTKKEIQISLLQLYRDIYRPGKFRDLWYFWNGRPLVHANPNVILNALKDKNASPEDRRDWGEILRFFTFRPLQPGYALGPQAADEWCWLEVFPQHGYVRKKNGSFEMAAAGVAQNHSWNAEDGHAGLAAMNDRNIFGRAYVGPNEEELLPGEKLRFAPDRNPGKDEVNRFLWGENFAQQLDRAQELDPDYLFVTGWNEWSADLFPVWMGKKTAFPDQYSPEFSRDIEPSSGILKDHFYWQFVDGIRRFRGVRPQRAASESPIYRDPVRDTLPRNSVGYGQIPLKDETGRNDFVECHVRHDEESIIFSAVCAEKITDCSDLCWMRLFISITLEDETEPHWNHFQFIVNRISPENGEAVLEKCSKNGWNWKEVSRVRMDQNGNRLEISIPRTLLDQNGKKINLWFKWADNTSENGVDGEILDFFKHGDTAPDGRFLYRYFER